MKKTQRIELFKNIKKTFVSFVSIAVFVALATAIFLGINWSTTTFSRMVDKTVNDGNMYNAEIIYPYGFTEDFVKEIGRADDVSDAEGYYSAEELFRYDDFIYQARVISLTDRINIPTAIEGMLPSKKGEIAVQKFFADNHNIKIGDEIVFEHDDDGNAHAIANLLNEDLDGLKNDKATPDGIKALACDRYRVTALIETPQFINQYNVTYGVSQATSVPNDCIMYVDESSFDKDAFGGYSHVAVRNSKLDDYVSLTDEYNLNSDAIIDRIQPIATAYTDKRNKEVLDAVSNMEGSIQEKIDEGEKQVKDAEDKLDESAELLASNKKRLEDTRILLDNKQEEINAGRSAISSNEAKISLSEKELEAIQRTYDISCQVLDDIIFIDGYRENLKESLLTLHRLFDMYRDIIKEELPDDYLTLQLLDTLFEKLNSGYYDEHLDEFVEDYGKILEIIQNSDEYASIDKVIEDLNKLADEKYDIKLMIGAFEKIDEWYTNGTKNPEAILAAYKNLKASTYDEIAANPLIGVINSMTNIPGEGIKPLSNLVMLILTDPDAPADPQSVSDLSPVIKKYLESYGSTTATYNYLKTGAVQTAIENYRATASGGYDDPVIQQCKQAEDYVSLAYNIMEMASQCENPIAIAASVSLLSAMYDEYEDPITAIVGDCSDFMVIINKINDIITDDEIENKTPSLTTGMLELQEYLGNSDSKVIIDDFLLELKKFYADDSRTFEASIFRKLGNELKEWKDKLDTALELPPLLVAFYKIYKGTPMLEEMEDEIYKKVEEELINNNLPTAKEIVERIDEILDDGYEKFEDIAPDLEEMLDKLIEEIKLARDNLDDAERFLIEAWEKLKNAKQELKSAESAISDAQAQLDAAREEYNRALGALSAKEAELADAMVELDKGRKDVEDGKKKLAEYKDMVKEIETYDNAILGRNANAALASTLVPMKVMSKIKYTLSILFVIVGLFVCYSAISRIIFEDTKLVGTKKALGLSKREITLSYLLYALLAVIFGTVLGNVLAVCVLEPIISSALSANFILTNKQFYFNFKDALLFFLFELAASLLFAYLACHNTLSKRTVDLLNGNSQLKVKGQFFEKLPFWNRLPLFTRTVVINFFNDRKRVFATIVGISGCCSLLVCALLVFFNLYGTYDYQMENITKFDTVVYLNTDEDNALENVKRKLGFNDIESAPAFFSNIYYKKDDGTIINGTVYAYDDEAFRDFFGVTKDGKAIDKISNGIWINSVFAETNGLKAGDRIKTIDVKGNEKVVEIGGVFDYYLLKIQGVMNASTYEKVFGESYHDNMLTFNRGDNSIKDLFNILDGTKGFSSVYDSQKEANDLYDALISVLIIIVIAYFAISFVLAFIVLLNLYTMYVSEKKNEMLVMMINGYSRKDAKRYVYQDSIFLTIIGIIIGSLLGVVVGLLTINALNVDYIALLSRINVGTFLIAGAITAALSLVNCGIALRKVSKFKLTNINTQQ